MKDQLLHLTCQIDLEPGEKLSLPQALVGTVGPGRWVITVQPLRPNGLLPPRRHSAFLNSYAPEDEGLYDAYPTR